MNIGDTIPAVLGVDETGTEVTAQQFDGKRLVLYFYPKDLTPGCTTQACNLRDNYPSLLMQGYEIVGVSVNDAATHRKFIAKHALPFHLIADTEAVLAQQFGVYGEKKMYGRTYMGIFRTTFIINEQGIIERVITPKEVKVSAHAQQILNTNR